MVSRRRRGQSGRPTRARRLPERGVRYVQLWHGSGQPWDHHSDIERDIRLHAGEIDQPIAALLTDLKRLTYRYAGRDFRFTDAHGKVVREILA